MKFTSKCSTAMVSLLAISVLGGAVVSAAETEEAENAKTMVGSGKVTVEQATNTEDDDDKGKTTDPEEKGDKGTPDEVTPNPNKGPIKIERLSNLDFGSVKTSAKEIIKYAKPVIFDAETNPKERGALVQFNDVRSDVYGYSITAELTEQFANAAGKELTDSTITYKNAILKAADTNENDAPSFFATTFELKNDGNAITVLTADKAKNEGKGRYILEYGQSATYDETKEGAAKNGTADTAKTAVELKIPGKVASNMSIGDYTSKITWTVVTGK